MSSSLTPSNDEPSDLGPFGRFVAELKRRKVISAAGLYGAGSWVVIQAHDALGDIIFESPEVAGRRILILLAAGFPVALILAWVLQLRLEEPAERATNATDAPTPRGAKHLRPDTVAVLNFENLSPDPDNAYFSQGITEDVMTSLSQIPGLRVIPRESVSSFEADSRTTSEIAGELGAATLVMGSVRRSGSRVRVVTKVIDARTNDHLWTESYDRELGDIFKVQSEIASKVGHAVQRELSPADRQRIEDRGTSDPEAYDLYLRARFLWNQRSESSVAESVRYFQRALEHDPGFALAHSGLADAFTVLGIYGIREPLEVLRAARDSAAAALSIEPMLGEAVATEACVTAIYDWDWSAAEEGFRRAIELSPSYPTAHQWYAVNVLTPQGRFDDAIAQLELATELDPTSSAIGASRAIVAFYAREYATAVAEFEAVAEVHPRFSLVHLFLGLCRELGGEAVRGIQSLRLAVELAEESSETLAALGHALAVSGEKGEAAELLRRLEERAERAYVSPALLAQVLIGLGERDQALDSLDRAVEARSTDLIWIGVRPVYDPLRDADRFQAILGRLGLASSTVGPG